MEKAAAEAALGLLQPLEALSLDADTLRAATAAAVTYCDAQGAASFADLVERARRLIAHTHRRCRLIAWNVRMPLRLWAVHPRCPAHGPGYPRKLYMARARHWSRCVIVPSKGRTSANHNLHMQA